MGDKNRMKRPSNGRPYSTTIKDIAADLGVSAATVSRAFSKPDLLRDETRELVLDAAERLGYHPNLVARDLRLRETRLAFVVVPSLSPFFLEVFRGAEQAAREAGYALLMGHTDRDQAREQAFFDQVASHRADGVILVTSAGHSAIAARKARMPPVIVALETVEGVELPTVRVDHTAGAVEATRHLIRLGHRRIGHIAGPGHVSMAVHRREGYEQALREAKCELDPALVVEGAFNPASGETAMLQLMTSRNPPTAVFCGNDEMAVGAILAANRLKLRVPEDVSIIGFDDQRLAGLYNPGITTIQIPTTDLGFLAMVQLKRLLTGDLVTRDIMLPTRLIERSSTAPPKV